MALAVTSLTATAAPSHLQITGLHIDIPSATLFILGQQLNVGGPVVVTLGEFGDITQQCQSPGPTPTVITCKLSGGLPPAGEYLLTVSTGSAPTLTATSTFEPVSQNRPY